MRIQAPDLSRLVLLSTLFAAGLCGQAIVNGPVIIFIGPPGSGKSTQARLAAKELKIGILSAEDMIAANSAAFAKAETKGLSGITPRTDPVMNDIFGKMITAPEYRSGVILDGYPATKDHADYLRAMVADGRLPAPRLLRLEIDDEALRKRLGNKAGADFDQLLKDYHREMDMLQVYFPGAQIINVDATGTRKTVAERVRKAISEQVPVKTPS